MPASPHYLPPSGIKRFFGNISLVVLLNLLVKPGWVVVENLVQDRLGHAAYGTFAALLALTTVLALLSDLGLTHSTVKRLASEPAYLGEAFPTVLPLRLGLNLLALVIMEGVGLALGYRGEALGLLAAIGGSLLLTQYAQFLRGPLQAQQRFNTDALLSVLEKALLLGVVLALLPMGLSLERYVGARLTVAAFTAVLIYGLLMRLYGWVRYRWQWPVARAALVDSLPFALITLLYGVNERIDMIMLERLASPTEAGYYAGAYRWVDAVMMYIWTIMPLFFARFAAAVDDPQEQAALLQFGQRVVAVPMLLVCAFGLFQGKALFWQFQHSAPAEVQRMALCVGILFLNVLVHSLFAVYGALLNSTNHVRAVSRLVVASIVLNVGLNVVLLPRFGAVAAAVDTLLSALLVSGGYLWLLWRRTKVAMPWGLLGRLLAAFALLCLGWYGLQQLDLPMSWLTESALMGVALAGLVVLLGIVRVAELRRLWPR
ncbi:oligosaccharide flippase family protein [Hymenobacter sp. BT18]|uniref:oligosaccharide flippase family protein n=1 Tax=Hymenobacter sp. BT18 TaxID=2835648 RepID=UPI00143EB50F|nr:polysaccharide biosynthesis C-terminal domain-containing protein [Hymenobacter sp. BT18]QIX62933.1 oligosaccharide flippase family protein [Hymenobacter sp. BT18]